MLAPRTFSAGAASPRAASKADSMDWEALAPLLVVVGVKDATLLGSEAVPEGAGTELMEAEGTELDAVGITLLSVPLMDGGANELEAEAEAEGKKDEGIDGMTVPLG